MGWEDLSESTSPTLSDESIHPLNYDAENHQKSFTSGSITYNYSYDGDGRRVKRDYNDGTTHTTLFVYNANGQLIAEYNSDPVPPAPGGGGTSYLTTDHLGITRVVTNLTGGVKARHDYLPFGEDVASNVGSRSTVVGYDLQDGVRQKFTRKERDNESGLDYFGARYYSSPQGRFASVDPARGSVRPLNPQSWNEYPYVLNNPLALYDPDGKWPKSIHELIIDRAFPGLSNHQRGVLKKASERVDSILLGGQDPAMAYQHGMRAPGQSVKEAKRLAKGFIKTQEGIAREAAALVPSVDELSDKAIEAFGKALHTITDQMSPAHEGFQIWYGLPDFGPLTLFEAYEAWAHGQGEKEISDPMLEQVVSAARKAFEETFGPYLAQWAQLSAVVGTESDPNVKDIRAKYNPSLTPCVLCAPGRLEFLDISSNPRRYGLKAAQARVAESSATKRLRNVPKFEGLAERAIRLSEFKGG